MRCLPRNNDSGVSVHVLLIVLKAASLLGANNAGQSGLDAGSEAHREQLDIVVINRGCIVAHPGQSVGHLEFGGLDHGFQVRLDVLLQLVREGASQVPVWEMSVCSFEEISRVDGVRVAV